MGAIKPPSFYSHIKLTQILQENLFKNSGYPEEGIFLKLAVTKNNLIQLQLFPHEKIKTGARLIHSVIAIPFYSNFLIQLSNYLLSIYFNLNFQYPN
jgi:hypothetical protein